MEYNGIASVEIDGSEYKGYTNTLTVIDELDKPKVMSWVSRENAYFEDTFQPSPFCEAFIAAGGSIIFGGFCQGDPNIQLIPGGRQYTINAKSFLEHTRFKTMDEYYKNWAISDIYKAVVDKYLASDFGHTTNNVEDYLEYVSMDFRGMSLYDGLAKIAQLAQYTFYVDENKDHHFEQPFLNIVSTEITDEHIVSSQSSHLRTDLEVLANRVWVEGGEAPMQRETVQRIASTDFLVNAPEDETGEAVYESFKYKIPVWYKNRDFKVYVLMGQPGQSLEDAEPYPLEVARPDDGDIRKLFPTKEDLKDQFSKMEIQLQNWSERNWVTSEAWWQSKGITTPNYDVYYDSTPTEESDGGWLYLNDMLTQLCEKDKFDMTLNTITGEEVVHYEPKRLSWNRDAASFIARYQENSNIKGKVLGIMLIYRRIMKLQYRTPVDAESYAKYGIAIDLPKISMKNILTFDTLKKYGDYELERHKDPPKVGTLTVKRYFNGSQVYPVTIKAGDVIKFNSSTFGEYTNIKVMRVEHVFNNNSWFMRLELRLQKDLYYQLARDMILRLHRLESTDNPSGPIETTRSLIETLQAAPDMVISEGDGISQFDLERFGAAEWN